MLTSSISFYATLLGEVGKVFLWKWGVTYDAKHDLERHNVWYVQTELKMCRHIYDYKRLNTQKKKKSFACRIGCLCFQQERGLVCVANTATGNTLGCVWHSLAEIYSAKSFKLFDCGGIHRVLVDRLFTHFKGLTSLFFLGGRR